jgi:hypothetical protein
VTAHSGLKPTAHSGLKLGGLTSQVGLKTDAPNPEYAVGVNPEYAVGFYFFGIQLSQVHRPVRTFV